MQRLFLVLALILTLSSPFARDAAASQRNIDAVVEIARDGGSSWDDPEGLLEFVGSAAGERYTWNVSTIDAYSVLEFLIHGGFDIDRVRQLVPYLYVAGQEYPLFEPVHRTDIWDVNGPVRITNGTGENGEFVLRLGIPGPVDASLVLARDVVPPALLGLSVINVTDSRFFAEANVNELARANLQVREAGASEWMNNPTAIYHYTHYFPVQGLKAGRTYEYRLSVTDWAGNSRTLPSANVTMLEKTILPAPVITPISPAQGGVIDTNVVTVRALIALMNGSLERDGVSVFLDKKSVAEGWSMDGDVFTFTTPALAPGLHTISISARQEGGGETEAFWEFSVAQREVPSVGILHALIAVVAAAFAVSSRKEGRGDFSQAA